MFVPHLDLVGSGNFQFPENDYNISPFSKQNRAFSSANVVTVSLSSVAAVCGLDRETTAQHLKEVFVKFIENARKGKFCKLDLKIGHLVAFPNGQLQFVNYQHAYNTEAEGFDLSNDMRFARGDARSNSVLGHHRDD